MPDAIKASLAIVPATLTGLAAFFLSFAFSGALWFNLAAGLLAYLAVVWLFLRHSSGFGFAGLGGAACLLGLTLAPTTLDRLRSRPQPESDDLVRRLSARAFPLATLDPDAGLSDLAPLARVWDGARVVALGEATHGTSEFFRMKHRLTRYLVTQLGFRDFAMEMEERRAKPLDDYIQGTTAVNPVRALYWPWNTQEYAAMIDWMRQYNQSAAPVARIRFHGIDYQGERRDFRMAGNMLDLLERLGPQGRVVLWAHNGHISSGAGAMGSYLKRSLGNQVYLAGFEFHHGRFTSRMSWIHTYQAEPAVDGYYAAALARTRSPLLFLDFRTLEADPALEAWLQQPRYGHELQEMHGLLRLNPRWVRTAESWPSLFDGIVYIEQSTPAHPF